METPGYFRPVRRVVTGTDGAGRSCVVSDAPSARIAVDPQYVLEDLWSMGLPAAVDGDPDVPARAGGAIAAGTILWRTCTIPAGEEIGVHATDTVDCLTVLSGRLTLVLEAEEVTLERGDCVVQRNTRHGWRNLGPEPCVLIAAMASTVA